MTTYEQWRASLPSDTRWAHCGNRAPHPAHTHTIVFNEGPYPDTPCVGTPRFDVVDDVRAELISHMLAGGPLCPADLHPDVWGAVAANYYDDNGWAPGPEYHAEYRDARAAVQALVSKVAGVLREMGKQQDRTEELGDREVAWYYYRGDIAEALGLPRDAFASESELFETAPERENREDREDREEHNA